MSNEPPEYLSYLLRLWRESDAEKRHRRTGPAVWRATLENALTGERQGFHGLDALFTFLRQATGVVFDGAERDNDV
jgi:hypothetical protein